MKFDGTKLKEVGLAILRNLGPVATAVKGELSKQETARAVMKAGLVFIATRTSVAATVQQPDFQTDVLIPLTAATLTGALDAMSRLQQGEPKPTLGLPLFPPPDIPPPEPQPCPVPSPPSVPPPPR